MKRRQFLALTAATFAAPAVMTRRAFAAEPGAPLPIPQVMEVGPGAGNTLTAMKGTREFLDQRPTRWVTSRIFWARFCGFSAGARQGST